MRTALRALAGVVIIIALAASGGGCVTAMSYRTLADIHPRVIVEPVALAKLEAVEVRRLEAGAIVVFSATLREGGRSSFHGQVRAPDPAAGTEAAARAAAAARKEITAIDVGPGWPVAPEILGGPGARGDPAAAKTAALEGDRVRILLDGRPSVLSPGRFASEPRTARRIAGWTGFILLLPLTVVADIVTFPVQVLILN